PKMRDKGMDWGKERRVMGYHAWPRKIVSEWS
ncbi:MAG: hypothetical protein ACI81Q_001516, partial [Paracoccaceae bacterium]